MIRPARLGAAATIAALGVSMATPALDSAAAAGNPLTLPATSQLTTALETLVSSSSASSLAGEIATLGTSGVSSTTLNPLDTTLGPLVGSLATLLASLLDPVAASLETTISSFANLAPSGGASSAQSQALSELTAVLSSNGLGTLLAGLTADGGASALTQLSALQSLAPGASTSAGGLSSLTAIVASLASHAGAGTSATSLTGLESIFSSGSALTPAQLESAITGLLAVTSTAASGTSGVNVTQVAQALASQLAQSGSLFGGLATVGSPLSALTGSASTGELSAAMTQLSALPSSVPGATTALSGLGPILEALANVNGIAGTQFGTDLSSLATTFDNEDGVLWSNVQSGLAELTANSANLPAPLNTLVANLAGALSGSGSIFGTLPNLSSTDATTALSELSSISGLGAGSSTTALPGLGAVLTALAATAPLAGTPVATVLTELSTAISENPLTARALAAVAAVFSDIAGALPAPLSTTVAGLGSELSSDAGTLAGTGGSGTGAGSSGTGTGASTGTSSTGTGSGGSSTKTGGTSTSGSSTLGAAARRYDWGLLKKSSRTGNAVTVTLYCFAAKGLKCTNTMKATETGFQALTRKVTMNAGKTDRFTLKLKQIATKRKATAKTKAKPKSKAKAKASTAVKKQATKRAVIHLKVTSGAYGASTTLK